ncbi:hypothetical protein AB7828_01075 [Tardiphaga sp. 215_C5_N2_1]|jgi:hypothetical protein|uniref:hypothetical protein n=1 Tax=Tardiphaga sp. 215_C5_N2_1 TaxID=3240774 RepID=UPI003F8A57FD
MTHLPTVPAIFWITLATTFGLIFWSTIVGRRFGALLPNKLRPIAEFYLAPSLGLAFLTVVASILGRCVPVGHNLLVPLVAFGGAAWAFFCEPSKVRMFRHASGVGLFGLACGSSLLVPLLFYGAFNAHNDAFTYLAHSGWLQSHSFSEKIAPEAVTPLTTQVLLYQQLGFRMGASFVLSFVQALSGLQWTYDVYPAVIITSVSACCLSIGFPIARPLRRLSRPLRFLVLTLPAFGAGGLVFAANFGFLPQILGMAFACAALFLLGPVVDWVSRARKIDGAFVKAGFVGALLISALTMAYSELVPFVGLALVISVIVLVVRNRSWSSVTVFGLIVVGISLLILNGEVLRAYNALKLQSGAVVGSPVAWSLLGFVAHAMGVHGAAWDGFQWTAPQASWATYLGGIALFVAFVALMSSLTTYRTWTMVCEPVLLPAAVILSVFGLGIVYFRYGVVSPFNVGRGQSWSQFKLSDWAHPFVSAFALLAFLSILPKRKTLSRRLIISLFICGFLGAGAIAKGRIRPYVQSYDGLRDIARFYTNFREAVLDACRLDAPVYLALSDRDEKFRRIAALYLPDREVQADWDPDVGAWLPESKRHEKLTADQCIVERRSANQVVASGRAIGPLVVGRLNENGHIRTLATVAAHEPESDGKDWWQWTDKSIVLQLQSLRVPTQLQRTRITFRYQARSTQTITLRLSGDEGAISRSFAVTSNELGTFDEVLDVRPTSVSQLDMTTDGKATPLGASDMRLAAWRVMNLSIEPSP